MFFFIKSVAETAGNDAGCSPVLVFLCPIAMCCVRGNIREAKGINVSFEIINPKKE